VRELPFLASIEQVEKAVSDFKPAALILEPIQGRSGVKPAPVAWLKAVQKIAAAAGALLIFDEVFTGIGRTGRLTFAGEVEADLVCFGKGLGGGFPISACVGRRAVMDAWPVSTGEALHTGTFFGHPLSCRIALATLQEIHSQGLAMRAALLGRDALSYLQHELQDCLPVKDVRGVGLMLAIEFHEKGHGAALMDKLRSRGIIALCSGAFGESLSITPALTIEDDLFRSALGTLVGTIREMAGH